MPGVFVMTGMLIMASVQLVVSMLIVAGVLLVICMLIVASVLLLVGVVLVLSYDLTNRSIARVASAIILSAEAASPATDASWTQWRTCSSSSPTATARECRRGGIDLGEDVDAIRVIGDHSLQPSHLALDPGETTQVLVLVQGVTAHRKLLIP